MVELNNVSFRYGVEESGNLHEASLVHVDLTVQDGEFVLLTGPSGCGKTTILRLINGLIPHFYPGVTEGSITVNGRSVQERELYETALQVGTVFQNPRSQFYNVDTTGELAFGCENRGLPEKEIYARIDDTVRRFGIEKLMDRNIFRLSDGEKQKIACASVDVAGSEIILLDEPSANLDYSATLDLREMIRFWRARGKTIIAAEHRIAYLWDLIDRAVILRDGKIVKELSGEEKNALTDEELSVMGLRSVTPEAPDEIELPALKESDRTMVLRDFAFSYPGAKQPALNLRELRLAVGEITAITGANGAGKTSFLNCLCGLEKRCRGTLEYEGKRYDRKKRDSGREGTRRRTPETTGSGQLSGPASPEPFRWSEAAPGYRLRFGFGAKAPASGRAHQRAGLCPYDGNGGAVKPAARHGDDDPCGDPRQRADPCLLRQKAFF